MTAYSRTKGNRAEVAVVHALERLGHPAATTRNARAGTQGGHDIVCDLPVDLEVKDQSRDALPGWLDQARLQASDGFGAVVHKRRGRSAAEDWFVTMAFADFVTLVDQLRTAPLSDQEVRW